MDVAVSCSSTAPNVKYDIYKVLFCVGPHLQLLLSLQSKLFEGLDDDSCVGAVVNKDGGAPHPRLEVVDRQRDVLSVVLGKEENNKRQMQKSEIKALHRSL